MFFKTALFEVPLYKTKVRNHAKVKEYIRTKVLPAFLEHGPNNEGLNVYSNYFPNAVPCDEDFLREMYDQELQEFMVKAGFNKLKKWDFGVKFWYNLSFAGAYQEQHHHLSGPKTVTYAGIHFVEFDPSEHISTRFFNPMEMVLKSLQPTLNPNFTPGDFKDLQKNADVTEGDMIMFPSYVAHCVPMQPSNKLRATIAMNISISEA